MVEGLQVTRMTLAAPDGRVLVRDLSLSWPMGTKVWVDGPPGSGKRALLKVLAGLLPPDQGEVSLKGIRLWPGDGAAALRGRVSTGFAFAQGGLLSNQSLRENLALPLRFAGCQAAEVDARVEATLERLGLRAVAALRPHALGIQVRKLAQLARIEALQPEVIFLSEPLEELEGHELALAQGLLESWSARVGVLLVAAADEASSTLMPGALRVRLEGGSIHEAEGAS